MSRENQGGLTDGQILQQDEAVRRQQEKRNKQQTEGTREWAEALEKKILGRNIIDSGKYSVVTRNFSSLLYVFTRQDIGNRFYSWRIWFASSFWLVCWFLISSLLHSDMKATVGMEGLGFDVQMLIFTVLYMVVGVRRKRESKKNIDYIISTSQGDYKELFYKISMKHTALIEAVFTFAAIGLIALIGSLFSPTSLHILLLISAMFKWTIDGKERGLRLHKEHNKADAELDAHENAMRED